MCCGTVVSKRATVPSGIKVQRARVVVVAGGWPHRDTLFILPHCFHVTHSHENISHAVLHSVFWMELKWHQTKNIRPAEGGKKKLLSAARIDNDKSTSSHLSFVEIGVEASVPFLSHLTVCVMFICSYTVSALLHDSQETPKQGAYISKWVPFSQQQRGCIYSGSRLGAQYNFLSVEFSTFSPHFPLHKYFCMQHIQVVDALNIIRHNVVFSANTAWKDGCSACWRWASGGFSVIHYSNKDEI